MSFQDVTEKVVNFCGKNSQQILTGCAIASTVGAVGATYAEAPTIQKKIDYHKEAKSSWKTVLKDLTPNVLPIALTTGAAVAFEVAACHAGTKRAVALTAAWEISETARKNYIQTVREKLGEKKEEEIRQEMHAKEISKLDKKGNSAPVVLSGARQLWREEVTGCMFVSDYESIRAIVNDANERMLSEHYYGYWELLCDLGINEDMMPKIAQEIGWNIETTGGIEICCDTTMIPDGAYKNEIIGTLDFFNRPEPRYQYFD
jgi:hypothetical protein